MPLNKEALYRYRLIDERLNNTMLPPPSIEELRDFISSKLEKEVSRRTILRDIGDMKEDVDLKYYAPILYDKAKKGYYYSESGYSIRQIPINEYELQGLEIALGILQQFHRLPIIKQFEETILKLADVVSVNRKKLEAKGLIHLDIPDLFRGLEWLPEIAEAIGQKEILRLRYQAFDRNEPKEYLIEPYHLREYNHRFYVFAWSLKGERSGLRTFGLDRIIDIWPTFEYFKERRFDEGLYFRDAIGITVTKDKPQEILLSFTSLMGKYVKAQPLHASQKIIEEDKNGLQIRLFLVINPELITLLLGYGSNVRILRPASLAEKIKEEAQRITDAYR